MKNILLALICFSLFGCIKDDGHYDYQPMRKLDVENISLSIPLAEGEQIVLTPKVIKKYDKTKTPIENVKFEWSINHKVVSNEPSYTFVAKEIGEFQGMLRMTDPLTQSISCYTFTITVKTKYASGLLILSEENGKSQLSFIRSKWLYDKVDTVIYDGEWKNIYATENGGEELKGLPVSLNEHGVYDLHNTIFGEITIMTREGGKVYVQELNGETLKRETYIEQEFDGGVVPENFKPVETLQTCYDSFILDESGCVYIRRSATNEAFHTGYFSHKITLWNGQQFSKLMFAKYNSINAILALEKDQQTGEQNFVGIMSGYMNDKKNLRRLTLYAADNSVDINDFNGIKDECISSDWCRAINGRGQSYQSGMSVLFKSLVGDYILHYFVLEEAEESSIGVSKSVKINLTKEKGMSKVNGMCSNKLRNYTYIWDDNTIYALDNTSNRLSAQDIRTVKTFTKKIVAVADQSIQSRRNKYPTALAVAFEDGTVEIWELEREEPYKFRKKLYASENSFGNIKAMLVKAGSSNVFFNM